jgi:hypothetical protein
MADPVRGPSAHRVKAAHKSAVLVSAVTLA